MNNNANDIITIESIELLDNPIPVKVNAAVIAGTVNMPKKTSMTMISHMAISSNKFIPKKENMRLIREKKEWKTREKYLNKTLFYEIVQTIDYGEN